MRKQYHIRPGASGLEAWDVDRLVEQAAGLPVEPVPVDAIAEVDDAYWFGDDQEPTVRAIVTHVRLIEEVDVSYPIILDPDGRLMDGMHRVARAMLEGRATVPAVRLRTLPPPDFTDCRLGDLPYPDVG